MTLKIIIISILATVSTCTFAMGESCGFSSDTEISKCISCVEHYDSPQEVIENCKDKFNKDRSDDPQGTGTNDFGLNFLNYDAWSCVCFPEE